MLTLQKYGFAARLISLRNIFRDVMFRHFSDAKIFITKSRPIHRLCMPANESVAHSVYCRDRGTREEYRVGWKAVSAEIITACRRAQIRDRLYHRLLE